MSSTSFMILVVLVIWPMIRTTTYKFDEKMKLYGNEHFTMFSAHHDFGPYSTTKRADHVHVHHRPILTSEESQLNHSNTLLRHLVISTTPLWVPRDIVQGKQIRMVSPMAERQTGHLVRAGAHIEQHSVWPHGMNTMLMFSSIHTVHCRWSWSLLSSPMACMASAENKICKKKSNTVTPSTSSQACSTHSSPVSTPLK